MKSLDKLRDENKSLTSNLITKPKECENLHSKLRTNEFEGENECQSHIGEIGLLKTKFKS